MDWGLVLGAIGVIAVPVGIGIGVTMATPSQGEFWFARGCFILAAILSLAALAWLTFEEAMGPTKIIVAGVIGALTAISLVVGLSWIAEREGGAVTGARPSAGLYVECTSAPNPIKLPSDGRIFALQPWFLPVENGGGGMPQFTGAPGSDYKFSDNPFHVYRCQITNYEDAAVFSVDLVFSVRFTEVVRQANGALQSGKTVLERPWPVRIGKIDPGISNPFVFYVAPSVPDKFTFITFPTEGMAQRLGEQKQTPIRLTNGGNVLGLSPLEIPKNAPSEPTRNN